MAMVKMMNLLGKGLNGHRESDAFVGEGRD
jgi:hypothetical protein